MLNDTILITAPKSFTINEPGLNRYSQIKIWKKRSSLLADGVSDEDKNFITLSLGLRPVEQNLFALYLNSFSY